MGAPNTPSHDSRDVATLKHYLLSTLISPNEPTVPWDELILWIDVTTPWVNEDSMYPRPMGTFVETAPTLSVWEQKFASIYKRVEAFVQNDQQESETDVLQDIARELVFPKQGAFLTTYGITDPNILSQYYALDRQVSNEQTITLLRVGDADASLPTKIVIYPNELVTMMR